MAWLGTYKYRFKMLIPAATATATLTDFPVTVNLGMVSGTDERDTTFIFEVCRDNYLKIAITDSDETTQLYCEVEKWDWENGKGCVHFKKPSITTSDNYYYIYFDDTQSDNTTYIGLSGTTAAKNVWTTDAKIIFNFADTDPSSTVQDSSPNTYTSTTYGSMTTADMVDGLIGRAIELDGTDDYITVANSTIPQMTTGTFEVMLSINPESAEGRPVFFDGYESTTYVKYWINYADNEWGVGINNIDEEDPPIDGTGEIQYYETWQCIQFTINSSDPEIFVDDVAYDPAAPTFRFYENKMIGKGYKVTLADPGYDITTLFCNMKVQAFRLYNTVKSDAYLSFSYLNFFDNVNTLSGCQFYDNIVNGTPFDLVGNRNYPVYYKLLIYHDSYDDLFVPIESFQFRHTTGNEAFLSVLIPDYSYYDSIVTRDGGQLRLHMLTGTMTDDDIDRDNLIVQVDLDVDNLRYDEGSDNKPITLDGYGIYGSRYLSLGLPYNSYKTYENETGTRRFRFPGPFYYLRTNDTVTVDGVEIDVLDMSCNRSGNSGQMELSDNG